MFVSVPIAVIRLVVFHCYISPACGNGGRGHTTGIFLGFHSEMDHSSCPCEVTAGGRSFLLSYVRHTASRSLSGASLLPADFRGWALNIRVTFRACSVLVCLAVHSRPGVACRNR